MDDYAFKTKPFDHQLTLFRETRNQYGYCIHWEMGCGKSKPIIDTGAWLYLDGKINAVVIVAPNGVHSNWRDNELPAHLPDAVAEQSHVHVWDAKTAKTKAAKDNFTKTLHHPGLAWLMIGYGALATDRCLEAAEEFLETRRCLFALDESARIKNPSSARTKALLRLRSFAPYRRTLTGTPITQTAFDVYAQVLFAFPGYWKSQGFGSWTAFKAYFGDWELVTDHGRDYEITEGDGTARKKGRTYEKLIRVKNLDELNRLIKPISSRLTKDEALDLPPKVYRTIKYQMSPEQKRMFKELKRDFVTWIDSEKAVTAEMAIQKLLRMQQLVQGYILADGEDEVTDLKDNPRLDVLSDILEDADGQTIIWARFRRDVDKIMDMLGGDAVRIYGGTSQDDRVCAVAAIQGGHKKFLVATAAAAGEGWTINRAKHSVYYSNTYRLTDRLQSEARNHRAGQDVSVLYTDIVAEGSLDAAVLRALKSKKNISDLVLGDEKMTWFNEE